MTTSTQRIQQHLEQLACFTASPGAGTTRMSYSPQGEQARNYLKAEMQALGLQVHEDAMGNVFGRLAGRRPDLPVILIGSHYDSVPNGGAFDGPAGVVMGLEVLTRFKQQAIMPLYPIEVVALAEEEGASFGRGLLASSAIAGKITFQDLETLKDGEGIPAAQRMREAGFTPEKIASVVRPPESIKAFIELHIEQGPVLEGADEDVGLVDVVVGISQLIVTIEGKAGHAGTTPMDLRHDALVAASQVISRTGDLAREAGEGTVATVGRLQVFPNGANVIPSKVIFTVDIRSKSEQKLKSVIHSIKELIVRQSEKDSHIICQIDQPLYVPPTRLNDSIHGILKEQSDRLGYRSRTMVSGAGHDAMIFAGITDVGLVFVPSRNGLSHHPDEWTDYEQVEKGIDVIFEAVKVLSGVVSS